MTGVQHVAVRLGGDEMAVLMPNVGPDEAARQAVLWLQNVQGLRIIDGDQALPRLGLSIGIGSLPVGEIGPGGERLLDMADKALYEAKKAGRNCIRIAEADSPIGHEA